MYIFFNLEDLYDFFKRSITHFWSFWRVLKGGFGVVGWCGWWEVGWCLGLVEISVGLWVEGGLGVLLTL